MIGNADNEGRVGDNPSSLKIDVLKIPGYHE